MRKRLPQGDYLSSRTPEKVLVYWLMGQCNELTYLPTKWQVPSSPTAKPDIEIANTVMTMLIGFMVEGTVVT